MKKIILLVGGIIVFAILGKLGWVIYEVKSHKGTNSYSLPAATATTLLPTSPTTIPTSNTASDQISEWETYTNTQYAFSFKYPRSFGGISQTTSLEHNYVELKRSNGTNYLLVYFPFIFINQTTKQPITFDELTSIYNGSGYDKKTPIVGGILSVSAQNPQIGRNVFVPLRDNQIMEIDGPRDDKMFDDILSTFKFDQ